MIVKWEDAEGTSYFDFVVHVSRLKNEQVVKFTQATLDHNVVSREFTHGQLAVLTDKGVVIERYDLGAPVVIQKLAS